MIRSDLRPSSKRMCSGPWFDMRTCLSIVLSILSLLVMQHVKCFAHDKLHMSRLGELRRAVDAAVGDEDAVILWLAEGHDLDVSGIVPAKCTLAMAEFEELHQALTDASVVDWRRGAIVFDNRLVYQGMPWSAFVREFQNLMDFGLMSMREKVRMAVYGPVTTKTHSGTWVLTGNELVGNTTYGKFVFTRMHSEFALVSWEDDLGRVRMSMLTEVVASVQRNGYRIVIAEARDLASDSVAVYIDNVPTFNPLLSAVTNGQTGVTRILLEAGANTSPDGRDWPSVIHVASRHDRARIIDILVEAGVDPDMKDAEGETALFYAVRNNGFEALRCLLDHDASYTIRNNNGKTPLDLAVSQRNPFAVTPLKLAHPFHWSIALNLCVSRATKGRDYETFAPGAGLGLEMHYRITRKAWLTTEVGYSIRTAAARSDEVWLPAFPYVDMPEFEYRHLEISPRLNWALAALGSGRAYGIVGLEHRMQMSARLTGEAEALEPIDVGDLLSSSGLAATIGIGGERFTGTGMLVGIELRRSMTMSGDYTSKGGGLNSWVLLFRVGS